MTDADIITVPPVRDESGEISPDFLRAVEDAINRGEIGELRRLVRDLHEADLADVIELLSHDERIRLIEMLDRSFNVEALSELDENVRDELVEALPPRVIARAVRNLDTDDAAWLLEDLDEEEKREILKRVPKTERVAVERALHYEEDTAGRHMQTDFVAVPEHWTVGETIDYLRTEKDLPDEFYEIYIVDPRFHVLGKVSTARLLRTPREHRITDIMEKFDAVFHDRDDIEDVARQFERYNLVSAPVVDDSGRLIGSLYIDDIVDVLEEEAEEDMLGLAGVHDEEITSSVWETARARFVWLLVNLGTAVLASWVISLFDATIQQMVALAVLMPIVASMGGNAGTQTMAVTVRALATQELGRANLWRVVFREVAVGLLNGLMFAVIMGVFTWWWFGSDQLGLVIGMAMVVNLLAAALSGILIPLALEKVGADPALASTIFVTTVTDVVGFFAFLGLAAWWLGLN